MTLSMHQASVPVFQHTLTAFLTILDKAAASASARKIDPQVLMHARLAPDMFALPRQVQIACDAAKGAVARLAGADVPRTPDTETSLEELKARVQSTLQFIGGFEAAQIDGSEDREILLPVGPETMTFKGQPYLLNFALPNFFFHITAAYCILRHNGVDVGKRDFLGGL